jgi:hypothetical protein
MNRLRLPIVAATLVGASVLAACGGGSATPTPAAQTVTPTAAAPSTGAGSTVAPTAAQASAGAGSSQGAEPSFALPSFASDNDLAAEFPKTIDGQPVSKVQTLLFIDMLNFAQQSATQVQQLRQSLSSFGIDLNKLSFGSADATVGGEDVQLQALRAPGADASQIVAHYSEIGAAFNEALGNPQPSTPPTISQTSVGGKNVTLSTDADGTKTYVYPSGDTIWIMANMTDAQAATILGALP